MKNVLTVQETAEQLRVSRATVWRWCKDGTLASAFRIGRNWRIQQVEIERIMEQSGVDTANSRLRVETQG